MIEHLGIEIAEVNDESLVGSMPVDHRTHQPYGILHGGASAVLAETLGSFASQMCTADPANDKVVGIEISVNHLRQVREGKVYGTASPVKLGRRLHIWQVDLHDEEDRHISRARLSVMVIS